MGPIVGCVDSGVRCAFGLTAGWFTGASNIDGKKELRSNFKADSAGILI